MSFARTDQKARVAKSFHRRLLTVGAMATLVLTIAVVPATYASAAPSLSALSIARGTLLATMADPGATASDYVGYATAMSHTTAVVGPVGANMDEGTVYIFEKGRSGWPSTPTASLTDPAATANDEFGFSVAVATSGTTVIVGAPNTNSNEGAVYIYEKGTSGWPSTPTVTLTDPTPAQGDFFGYSVAVSKWTAMTASSARPVLARTPGRPSFM
jgi:FG-GAP repeat